MKLKQDGQTEFEISEQLSSQFTPDFSPIINGSSILAHVKIQ
jgi:hypothetical protein